MNEIEIKEDITTSLLGSPSDPRSLRSMLPNSFVLASQKITDEHMNLTDKEILKQLSTETEIKLCRLRESIWLQIHANHGYTRKITNRMIHTGITSVRGMEHQLKYPERVVFLLRPPTDYNLAMKEALTCSVEMIRDILAQSHIDSNGELNPKIADVKRRIFENLSDRVKGMPIQRTENLNLNKEVGAGENINTSVPTSAEDIDKKIKELETEISGEKDVTPVDA